MLGSGAGGRRGRSSLAAREGTAAVRCERAVLFCGLCSAGLFCIFPFSVSLLLLFPLFAVLLNCPYPDPPVSACFFPFSFALRRGEEQLRGTFVAGGSPFNLIQCSKGKGGGKRSCRHCNWHCPSIRPFRPSSAAGSHSPLNRHHRCCRNSRCPGFPDRHGSSCSSSSSPSSSSRHRS